MQEARYQISLVCFYLYKLLKKLSSVVSESKQVRGCLGHGGCCKAERKELQMATENTRVCPFLILTGDDFMDVHMR